MRFKLLIVGFLLSIILIAFIGFYALNVNQKIIATFEEGEKHFKSVTMAATEVSSYAKRAEGHMMLYLLLHREKDKEKFPQRIKSLNDHISLLDEKIKNPEGRAILDQIKADTKDILPIGNSLIAAHDSAIASNEEFDIEKYRDVILGLHEKFAKTRECGVDLAKLEIKLENDLKQAVYKHAARLQLFMRILTALTSIFALYLGFTMIEMIRTLNKEIANRRQSETALQKERNKLQEALSEVKTLSGLLPICSSCKKIRDDKGYWNQIEKYIGDHSEAEFSHGICPECAKKLYADDNDDELKN